MFCFISFCDNCDYKYSLLSPVEWEELNRIQSGLEDQEKGRVVEGQESSSDKSRVDGQEETSEQRTNDGASTDNHVTCQFLDLTFPLHNYVHRR